MAEPIASLQRLEELGLDRAKYGSCSEPDQRKIVNKGRVWFNRGCTAYYDCPWKGTTAHMKQKDASDVNPRPRNVATKFIKPNSSGPGDRIINSFCSCFQYHRGLKKRDGKNNEIVEVVGGEGDDVLLKGSTRNVKPDATVFYTPVANKVEVPRYPDPSEVPELFEDVYAGRDRLANKAKTDGAERSRRLTGAVAKESEFEGVTTQDIGPDHAA